MFTPRCVDEMTLVVRVLLACLLGGALGFDRELRGQAAGLRTHTLVAVGACLFTVAGAYAFGRSSELHGFRGLDPSRIASQVVVGIGFLGGGAIIRDRGSIRGLTTAANLWIAASVGLAVGVGLYVAATVTTGLVLVVLVGLKPVERWLKGRRQARR